jgi:competence protein ComX
MTYYLEEEKFQILFSEMKPIIMKLMKQIRIRTWAKEDYLQEGMIVLHLLLEEQRESQRLHTKFKVKYHQHLIDELRRSYAKKRSHDHFIGLDVYECSDWIAAGESNPENELVFNHLLAEVYEGLSAHYQELLIRQMQGEDLTRMERYRLREKIKAILFSEDED